MGMDPPEAEWRSKDQLMVKLLQQKGRDAQNEHGGHRGPSSHCRPEVFSRDPGRGRS